MSDATPVSHEPVSVHPHACGEDTGLNGHLRPSKKDKALPVFHNPSRISVRPYFKPLFISGRVHHNATCIIRHLCADFLPQVIAQVSGAATGRIGKARERIVCGIRPGQTEGVGKGSAGRKKIGQDRYRISYVHGAVVIGIG